MASPQTIQDRIDPGAMLASTHELSDGSRVRLRLTRPTDLPKIEAFLESLSATPEALVRHYAFYDPRERLVLAATMPRAGGEEIVGLAEVTLAATGSDEIAVVAGEDSQGRGVRTLLSQAGASLAIHRGRNAA